MRYALSVRQMRSLEDSAVQAGTPLGVLMERAGAAVAEHVSTSCPQGPVLVAAGGGNNGGDGWVAARLLAESGRDVRVVSVADPDGLPEPARWAAASAIAQGIAWSRSDDTDAPCFASASCIVDALLGVGATGAPRGEYARLIAAMRRSRAAIVAVDIPSGVDADTGEVPGVAVQADATVTFAGPKLGCVLEPGASHAGALLAADIGLATDATDGLAGAPEVWDGADYAARLRLPRWDDTKASRGRVLVIGGSPGMSGAACLAAGGALRSGAGYVSVAVPAASLRVVEAKLTAPVKLALPQADDGSLAHSAVAVALEAAGRADAVVLGPGLGRSAGTIDFALALLERLACPVVVDADALFALGSDLDMVARRSSPTVLTPHAGEAARLLGRPASSRIEAARALAVGSAVAVLKGPSTLIAGSGRLVVNPSGGPGLATLGTGDVLAGAIAAFLAAGLSPLEAGVVGTYLHGAAGDAAAGNLTPLSMTAEDVVAHLPHAMRHLLDIRAACAEED